MRMSETYCLFVVLLLSCFVSAQQKQAPSATQGGIDPVPSMVQVAERPDAAKSAPDLKPDANGALSQEQIRVLVRRVADNDLANDKKQRDYTYIQQQDERKLDGHGKVKSTETKTYEILMLYGEQVERLIARDGKPLSDKDAAKEEQKIQKLLDKRRNESEDDRRKRLAKKEEEREKGRRFVREIADAYNFRLVGSELVEGRDTYVIDADPRPGYQPQMKEGSTRLRLSGSNWTPSSLTPFPLACFWRGCTRVPGC
jgi:hypothetical protein